MGRPSGTLSVEYNGGCDMPTCSAVGTIHIVARDFNPWNMQTQSIICLLIPAQFFSC